MSSLLDSLQVKFNGALDNIRQIPNLILGNFLGVMIAEEVNSQVVDFYVYARAVRLFENRTFFAHDLVLILF
jgi:hypothetical protein